MILAGLELALVLGVIWNACKGSHCKEKGALHSRRRQPSESTTHKSCESKRFNQTRKGEDSQTLAEAANKQTVIPRAVCEDDGPKALAL